MSKTISGPKLAARAKKFFSRLPSIARETCLIVRSSSKFTADGFLIALLQSVSSGKASFNQLAISLALSGAKPLSKQALWKRVDATAVSFMMEVTKRALEDRWSQEVLIASKSFNRVIIEDSSQIKLPKSNSKDFPAHGNGKGETAGCKIDLAFDLLTGEPILQSLQLATAQDKELGKDLVDLVRPNDLFLRDMGYFGFSEFLRIEEVGASWLSRLPINVKAWCLQGSKLEDILRGTKCNRVDLQMVLGEVRHQGRLIAVRATLEVAAQQRRERIEQADRHGKQPSKDTLTRCDWHIIVTNVIASRMDADKLFKLYRVRWSIEIDFRAWKQSGHLAQALKRHSNIFHLQVLMLAGILLLILTMKVTKLLQASCPDEVVSIEKVADSLTSFMLRITSLSELESYNPDSRHVKMDRRTRQTLRKIAIAALS